MATLYYKTIGGNTVFSYCKSIRTASGVSSNPSAEQIAAEGWQVYVPPVVPPQPATEPGYGTILEAVKRMLSTETEELTDEEALDVAALFPTFVSKIGQSVNAGERLWWDGRLWKALQNIPELLANWTPDTATSLFVEVSIEEWPAWRQPLGSEDGYDFGAHVAHVNKHWESIYDGKNVWEPGAIGSENLWQQI